MGAGFSFPPLVELQEAKTKSKDLVKRYDALEKRYADFTIANDELKETNR